MVEKDGRQKIEIATEVRSSLWMPLAAKMAAQGIEVRGGGIVLGSLAGSP